MTRMAFSRCFHAFALVIVMLLAAHGTTTAAEAPSTQPTDEVKLLIAGLCKPDLTSKVDAALQLKEMGVDAVPAIPFLIDNLGNDDDGAPPGYHWTREVYTPASSASAALEKIIPLACGEGFKYAQAKLADRNAKLRGNVVSLLPLYGNDAIPPLLKALKFEGDEDAAEHALGKLGKAATGPLTGMLNEKIDDDLRRHVLLALEYGGDPSALPFFISAYEDKDFHDDWMKVELGEAICNLAGPDELDRVVSLLHVKENRTARAAAKALARIKTKPAIDALFAYVKVDGSPVRAEVVELIAGLDDPRSVPEVISAASDHDKTVRLFAVNAMGDRANALFVAPLMSALDDKDVNVRSQAIPALVKQKIDRRELFKTVLSKLDDKEPNVQSAASSALAGITGRHFGTDKKKWTDWYEAFGDEFKWDE